jgi:hypothetical protein
MIYVVLAVPLLVGLFLAHHAIGLSGSGFEVDLEKIEECRVSPRNWKLLDNAQRADYRRKLRADFSFVWRVCRMMAPMMEDSHKGLPLIRMWVDFHLAYLKLKFFRAEGESLVQSMIDVHCTVVNAVSAGFTEVAAGA